MTDYDITVVTPLLPGRDDYLPATAESISGQRGARIEWIISADGPGEFEVPARADKVVRTTRRGGAAQARNTGMLAASAPVLRFHDGDDVFARSDSVAADLDLLRASGAAGVISRSRQMNADGTVRGLSPFDIPSGEVPVGWIAEMWTRRHPQQFAVPLTVRADSLLRVGGIPALERLEDWSAITLINEYEPLHTSGEVTLHYRQHPAQITAAVVGDGIGTGDLHGSRIRYRAWAERLVAMRPDPSIRGEMTR